MSHMVFNRTLSDSKINNLTLNSAPQISDFQSEQKFSSLLLFLSPRVFHCPHTWRRGQLLPGYRPSAVVSAVAPTVRYIPNTIR